MARLGTTRASMLENATVHAEDPPDTDAIRSHLSHPPPASPLRKRSGTCNSIFSPSGSTEGPEPHSMVQRLSSLNEYRFDDRVSVYRLLESICCGTRSKYILFIGRSKYCPPGLKV